MKKLFYVLAILFVWSGCGCADGSLTSTNITFEDDNPVFYFEDITESIIDVDLLQHITKAVDTYCKEKESEELVSGYVVEWRGHLSGLYLTKKEALKRINKDPVGGTLYKVIEIPLEFSKEKCRGEYRIKGEK